MQIFSFLKCISTFKKHRKQDFYESTQESHRQVEPPECSFRPFPSSYFKLQVWVIDINKDGCCISISSTCSKMKPKHPRYECCNLVLQILSLCRADLGVELWFWVSTHTPAITVSLVEDSIQHISATARTRLMPTLNCMEVWDWFYSLTIAVRKTSRA